MGAIVSAHAAGPAAWLYLTAGRQGSGEVLAVYRRSLLWLAGPDEPLTLAWDPALRGPLTLETGAPVDGVAPGDPVRRQGALLLIGSHMVVDLRRIRLIDQPLPGLQSEDVAELVGALACHRLEGGLSWTQAALPQVELLVAGLHAVSESMVTTAVSRLIGLGPGLTPAGDDFLAGMLAALQATESGGSHHAEILSRAITRHLGQTTLVSRHFLTWAARRRYGDVIRRVFAAPGDPTALRGLLGTGATSGTDTAAGIQAGLTRVRCWRNNN